MSAPMKAHRLGTWTLPSGDSADVDLVEISKGLAELRTLRREHVHLEQGVVLLPRAKAGARPVVLSAEAQKILKGRLEAITGDWIFPSPDGRPYSRIHVSRVFRTAARGAGLQSFTFHDLRHHGATMALNAGFSAPIVQALGGWKTERAHDAAVRSGDRSDATSGGGGGQRK
jgi:integrase